MRASSRQRSKGEYSWEISATIEKIALIYVIDADNAGLTPIIQHKCKQLRWDEIYDDVIIERSGWILLIRRLYHNTWHCHRIHEHHSNYAIMPIRFFCENQFTDIVRFFNWIYIIFPKIFLVENMPEKLADGQMTAFPMTGSEQILFTWFWIAKRFDWDDMSSLNRPHSLTAVRVSGQRFFHLDRQYEQRARGESWLKYSFWCCPMRTNFLSVRRVANDSMRLCMHCFVVECRTAELFEIFFMNFGSDSTEFLKEPFRVENLWQERRADDFL